MLYAIGAARRLGVNRRALHACNLVLYIGPSAPQFPAKPTNQCAMCSVQKSPLRRRRRAPAILHNREIPASSLGSVKISYFKNMARRSAAQSSDSIPTQENQADDAGISGERILEIMKCLEKSTDLYAVISKGFRITARKQKQNARLS